MPVTFKHTFSDKKRNLSPRKDISEPLELMHQNMPLTTCIGKSVSIGPDQRPVGSGFEQVCDMHNSFKIVWAVARSEVRFTW